MNRHVRLAAASALALLLMLVILIVRPVLNLPDISALDRVIAGDAVVPIRTVTGSLIYEYRSPTYGEQVRVTLDEISDELVGLTLTTEDSRFFSNPGFSPAAIVRAVFQNLIMGQTFSGASTLTQQVVRNILLSEQERFTRSIFRKAKEILLAAAVTLRYDKEAILTIYMNEIYYGRNATGVEQAARNYFDKHASEITLPEAAFIAGLPQAPNYYGNDEAAGRKRQEYVLWLLYRVIQEDRCIPIRSGKDPGTWCPSKEELQKYLSIP